MRKSKGLKSSPEMLAKARSLRRARELDRRRCGDPGRPHAPYDVVFSNATLHWIADHRALLPRLMSHVADGGALAFQVPRNFDAPSHVLMREVANSGPWAAKLANARQVNVLSPDDYFDILAPLAKALDIWETTYLHVLEGDDPVLAWVSGTGLRPFVQPLDAGRARSFHRGIPRAAARSLSAPRRWQDAASLSAPVRGGAALIAKRDAVAARIGAADIAARHALDDVQAALELVLDTCVAHRGQLRRERVDRRVLLENCRAVGIGEVRLRGRGLRRRDCRPACRPAPPPHR